jgi:very-short-patch-repair endonuclease
VLNEDKCIYCGDTTRFLSLNKGYKNICANQQCNIKKGKATKFKRYGDETFSNSEKRKQTNLERYGVENYFQSENFPDQVKATCITKYNSNYYTNREKFKKTMVQRYGVENALQCNKFQNKHKETCLKKYGVDHNFKDEGCLEKRKKTYLERYGVDSYTKSPEFLIKTRNTCQERYGYDHAMMCPIRINRRRENNFTKYGVGNPGAIFKQRFSAISQELFWKIYEQLPEDLQKECYFAELNKERFLSDKNNYFLYDFCILDKKIIIEFQGDYWHKNPQTYEYNLKNLSVWLKDEFKKEIAEDNGFKVFYIWESEYLENKDNIVENITNKIITLTLLST